MKKLLVGIVTFVSAAALAIGIAGCKKNDHTHTLSYVPATKATCIQDGNVSYWFCSGCGKLFSDGEKKLPISSADTVEEATGHTWNEGVIDYEPTIQDLGRKTLTCTVCTSTMSVQLDRLPCTEHLENTIWGTDAEEHWEICIECNQPGEKEAHTWDDGAITTEPTTSSTGLKTYNCTVCGKDKSEVIPVLPHVHSYTDDWESDDVNHWHECSECREPKDSAAHTWESGKVLRPATTTETGSQQMTCSVCGKTKTVTLPLLPSSNQPTYELDSSKAHYVVTGFEGTISEITIPEIYNGLRVTEIAGGAFAGRNHVRVVTLPNSIQRIGASAFDGCINLTKVVIPESVTNIGAGAFNACSSLTTVQFVSDIPTERVSNLSISDGAFESCVTLTSITLPKNTKSIGDSVFANCYSLKNVSLNENLESIGSFAFDGCRALTEITLPDVIKSVPTGAFRNAASLASISMSDELVSVGTVAFQNCVSLTAISLPDDVTSIGASAFSGCTGLESVSINGNLTSLGDSAFYDCTALKNLYYNSSSHLSLARENYILYNAGTKGDGITLTVGEDGYLPDRLVEPMHKENLPKITMIEVEDGATQVNYLTQYNYMPYVTSIEIADSVTNVNKLSFSGCPETVFAEDDNAYYLGNSANAYRYLLTTKSDTIDTLTISADAKFVSPYAFEGVTIRHLIIAESADEDEDNSESGEHSEIVENIPSTFAARAYGDLPYVTIPEYAFYNCTVLSADTPSRYIALIKNCGIRTLTVTGYDGISSSALADNTTLKTLVIGNKVTAIGNSAFYGCTALESVTLPEGFKTLGNNAFYYCTSLNEINFNATAAYDLYSSNNAFYYAGRNGNGITVTFGANVERVPSYLFSSGGVNESPLITKVKFAENCVCTSIKSNAFSHCSNFRTIILPAGLTEIGDSAFYYCTALESIEFPDSLTSIGASAFYGCNFIESLTIPENVTSIGNYAFYNLSKLTEINYNATNINSLSSSSSNTFYNAGREGDGIKVTFGANVEKVPAYLFYTYNTSYTPKITEVEFEEGSVCTSIGSSAFYYCNLIESLTIPEGVTSIGSNAFYYCTALEKLNFNATSCENLSEGSNAFYYAGRNGDGLKVLFGSNVEVVPAYLFYTGSTSYSPKITEVTFEADSACTLICEYAFGYCTYLENVTIPESVTNIYTYAFYYCTALKNITFLAENCSDLASYNYAFYNAGRNGSGITVTFGAKVTKVPAYLFNPYNSTSYSPKITEVMFEQGSVCTEIGHDAFSYCNYLQTVMVPVSVNSIAGNAFYNCSSLSTVYYGGTEEDVTNIALDYGNTYWANATFWYYANCIHTDYLWRFDEDGNISTETEVSEWIVDQEPTCTEEGSKHGICAVCGNDTDAFVIPALGHDLGSDAVCTVCGITDTLYTVTNSSSYSWSGTGIDDVLTSTNKGNSSSSSYVITAKYKVTVSLEYSVSSESNYDYLTIYKNSTTEKRVSGNVSYTSYSTTLNAGDTITFTYSKDSSGNVGDDCGRIRNIVITLAD